MISLKTKLPYKPVVLLLVFLFYSTIGLVGALRGIKIATAAVSKASVQAVSILSGYATSLPGFSTSMRLPV